MDPEKSNTSTKPTQSVIITQPFLKNPAYKNLNASGVVIAK